LFILLGLHLKPPGKDYRKVKSDMSIMDKAMIFSWVIKIVLMIRSGLFIREFVGIGREGRPIVSGTNKTTPGIAWAERRETWLYITRYYFRTILPRPH